ncbi:hypothetical protein PIB30_019059 [Stylosanthes scabra]|uniref:Uncharacterized protein n=1 Tax=Stylosanthes scabra TaxID=79078 RepID=A0ABU6T8X6_9FABA|nr:hypothetical protein [Stylosanthes scabra]
MLPHTSEDNVPPSDTTPGYPSWQANRKKGFKPPVVTGPEPPIHMFDDPINYKAEMDYRYEDAFKQLEEKEIMLIQQWKRGKEDLCRQLDMTMNEVAEQKEKAKVLEAQFMKIKERCHFLETILEKRNQALKSYCREVEVLRQEIIEKNHKLRVENELISVLESENKKLQKNVEHFAATNEKWSEMYTTMEHGAIGLLRDIRDITSHAKKLSLQHPYRTRDELGHAQEEIKEEMNQMKEQIAKILELLQAITTNGIPAAIGGERTNVPQYLPNVASQGIITPHAMNQVFSTLVPIYGLPPGYVPHVVVTYSDNIITTQNMTNAIHPNVEISQAFPKF